MQRSVCGVPISAAVGVFDSGVGGLTVLRAIKDQLPFENLLYIADSGHAPYGERESSFIADRCHAIASFLCRQPVKAIVIACNTASVVAIETLRAEFDIPIVGIEPAIKPAASITRSGVVGVLATSRTLQSAGLQKLCDLYGQNVEIKLQACTGLVERIEQSQLNSDGTREMLNGFVQPLLEANADTIVLGCTHYPFVQNVIQSIAGESVSVIEPGAAVARQLNSRLTDLNLNRPSSQPGSVTFYTTGSAGSEANVISSLWNESVPVGYLQNV